MGIMHLKKQKIEMNHNKIIRFRKHIEKIYHRGNVNTNGGSFGEILCHELHEQPINGRMHIKTRTDGFCTGLTFKELAEKWGISISFLGELIADHCKKLEK